MTFAVISPSRANDVSASSLLKRHFGEDVEIRGEREIWYCPDSTCTIFQAHNSSADFPSYVYLYLFHRSKYVYLNQAFSGSKAFRARATEESEVRGKVQHYCSGGSSSPDCIINGMETTIGVQICSGRYDEGYFCYTCGSAESQCKRL